MFRETKCGLTTVYVFEPEDIKALYAQEDSEPIVSVFLAALKQERIATKAPLGLGNMYVGILYVRAIDKMSMVRA